MKTVLKRFVFSTLAVLALCAFSLPCSAKDVSNTDKNSPVEFKITVPRAIAAGGAVLLFTASQIIVFNNTDKE